MPTAAPLIIEATDRASRDLQLEQATDLLKQRAKDCGILVTRHSFRRFSAQLSRDVEFGFIEEVDMV